MSQVKQASRAAWVRKALVGTAIAALLPAVAAAQTAVAAEEAPSDGLGEIVVTAQKREQNIQQVSLAISALGREALADLGRQDIDRKSTRLNSSH